jgi:hypothetical protein
VIAGDEERVWFIADLIECFQMVFRLRDWIAELLNHEKYGKVTNDIIGPISTFPGLFGTISLVHF